jgi:hypothetical protein
VIARFVVDESSWNVSLALVSDVVAALETFVDRLSVAREREEPVVKCSVLYEMEDVRAILFDSPRRFDLDRDLRLRLMLEINRLGNWDAEELPNPDSIVIDGHACEMAPSVAWAHGQVELRRAVACLPLTAAGRRGLLDVELAGRTAAVWFVTDEREHVSFFRDAISLENADEDEFALLAPSAFPDLCFVDGVWKGLRAFGKPYRELRNTLIDIFTQLSDRGTAIFGWSETENRATASNHDIASRFLGYQLAPESSYHLDDNRVREVRMRPFAGQNLLFSWHIKIEGHRDRIHIHPPIRESGGRVIVGILAEHLYLRGD